MSKGDKDILLVRAYALASDGAGVARADNRVVFVRGLLPGETARVLVTERRKSFWRAELLELIPPNPDAECHDGPNGPAEFPQQGNGQIRRLPACPVFDRCGGCDLQHMSYEATLYWKKQWIADAMARIAKVKVPVNDVIGLKEPWLYRNKATLHWDGLSLGWYTAKSHAVVEFADCLLLPQGMNETVKRLKTYLAAWAADLMTITLRQDTAGKVWLVNDSATGQEMLAQFDRSEEEAAETLGTAWAGDVEDYLIYQTDGLSIVVSPRAFLQVNTEQIHTLLRTVTEMADLKGGETVWDLYSGVGVLGLGLARNARAVVGIEENAQAVRDAYLNARRNGISNICFFTGKAEDILDSGLTCQEHRLEMVKVPPDFVMQAASVQCPDLVIVDPPRAGVSDCVLESIRRLQPAQILYVSCDPSTLARDVGRLAHAWDLPKARSGGGRGRHGKEGGHGEQIELDGNIRRNERNSVNSPEKVVYEVKEIQPIDMFPWTRHVECVVLMSRKPSNIFQINRIDKKPF